MGSSISMSVTNKTDYNLHICVKQQKTLLYYQNFVKPGQPFNVRDISKVIFGLPFTIEARIGTNELPNEYSKRRNMVVTLLISLPLLENVAVAGALEGVGAIVTSCDGSSVVRSGGWYAGQNRMFEICQRVVDEMDIILGEGERVDRFGEGTVVQLYLADV